MAQAAALEIEVRPAKSRSQSYSAPDLSVYTARTLRQQLPGGPAGEARIVLAEGERFLDEAIRRERGDDLHRRQGADTLRVIAVEGGVMSIGQLVEAIDDAEAIRREGGVVTLRLPLLVRPGATFVVDGQETPVLRLSTDRGAFLANAGKLYVLDADVIGWDESSDGPSEFVDKKQFRPFIASYIRSQTYLGGSRIAHLGYAAASSYGLSLTTQPERIHGEPNADAPTGTIVDNKFVDLYYGFYSFEARDVAIVKNDYERCVVYGVDPHDRTTRLLIAGNTTRGTLQRHGIIGSRGVSDSVIVGNTSHGNAGSGIMLDRQCTGNLIADNKVYDNGQGIAVYESDDNRVLGNLVADSAKSALRIRNSSGVLAVGNTLLNSGDYAIEFSARRLGDHDKRTRANDEYRPTLRAVVVNNRFAGNRGLAKANGLDEVVLAGAEIATNPQRLAAERLLPLKDPPYAGQDRQFGSDLKPFAHQLQPLFDREAVEVVITRPSVD